MKKTFNTLSELFNEMYKLGIQNIDSFLTDVIKDVETIKEVAEQCDTFTFYWIVRKHGTYLKENLQEAGEAYYVWREDVVFTQKIVKENGIITMTQVRIY